MFTLSKKIIILLLVPFFLLGLVQSAGAVTKLVGETAVINVICSDSDSNLFKCNVTSPCTKTCSVSGSSASCSCNFTCTSVGNYDACGEAIDERSESDSACLPNELQCVVNRPPDKPDVPDIYKPSGVVLDNCTFQGMSIPTFHWTYSDPDSDPQAAYEIEVDDNSGFQAPKFNNLVDVASTAYALTLSHDDDSDWLSVLAWNATYFWRVKVKDSYGNWSVWSDSHKFKTPKHAYPYPGFSWDPQEPTQEEVVVFNPDQTGVYYLWTVTEGEGVYADETGPTNEEPHIKFLSTVNRIKLKVTDSDGYFCESEPAEGTLLEAQLPLPEYKEVPPIIWLKNFFSELASIFNGLFRFATSS